MAIPYTTENMTTGPFTSNATPVRKGSRPKTMIGPLHIQCNGHGDPKYLKQLLESLRSSALSGTSGDLTGQSPLPGARSILRVSYGKSLPAAPYISLDVATSREYSRFVGL
jgi:hypothetical protein